MTESENRHQVSFNNEKEQGFSFVGVVLTLKLAHTRVLCVSGGLCGKASKYLAGKMLACAPVSSLNFIDKELFTFNVIRALSLSLWILLSIKYKNTLSSWSLLLVGLSSNSITTLTDLLHLHTCAEWFSFLHSGQVLPFAGLTRLSEYIPLQK